MKKKQPAAPLYSVAELYRATTTVCLREHAQGRMSEAEAVRILDAALVESIRQACAVVNAERIKRS